MGKIHGQQGISRTGHGCGCNDDPAVVVNAQLKKNQFGRGNWNVTFRNDEPFPVYLTMAVQEGPGSSDWDTVKRDVEVKPGCKANIEFPACGNGADKGDAYRVTVRNKCDVSIGVVSGELC